MNTACDLQRDADSTAAEARDCAAAFMPPYLALRAAVEAVGRAWCGTCVPDVGNLYERALQPLAPATPPAGGEAKPAQPMSRVPAALMASCRIWTPYEIGQAIRALAGRHDAAAMRTVSARAAGRFLQMRANLQRRLHDWQADHGANADVARLLAAIDQLVLDEPHAAAERWRAQRGWRQPQPLDSQRQSGLALSDHHRDPPRRQAGAALPDSSDAPARPRGRAGSFDATPAHIGEQAALQALHSPIDCLTRLGELLQRAADVLCRQQRSLGAWSAPEAAAADGTADRADDTPDADLAGLADLPPLPGLPLPLRGHIASVHAP